MKSNIIAFLLLFAGLFTSAQTKMNAAEIKQFTARISAESKKIKTLQANFVQTKKMDFLNKDLVTSGEMALQAPGMLSWKYTKPYQYSVVFKNGKMHINDQGKKSTINAKSKNFEKLNKLIIGSANGNLLNDPDFSVSYFKSGSNNMARFIPKSAQLLKYIKQVDLHFAPNQTVVTQVNMLEASGDTTNIVFKNTKVNAPVPAAAFSL
ncbi:LolA family protein [Chryseobacterium sp.]|uniref:LolA family protein n=1 Tax=Chryseobacterium sp. TaxID=1871047 RepID=UPI001E293F9B|nr:outer membrane lipoprotein carrier protein LolA [Chryseobacterium sp.]